MNLPIIFMLTVFAGSCVCTADAAELEIATRTVRETITNNRADYAFMWWAYGWRGQKIRCLQTSSYGMAMDVANMRVPHFGRIHNPAPYELAVAQSNDVVLSLPAAKLELAVETNGRKFVCREGGHPRLIASGRLLQRADVEGLVFKTEEGLVLPAEGRLEIIAWPDRLALILEVTPRQEMKAAQATVRFEAGAGAINQSSATAAWRKGETRTVSAVLFGPASEPMAASEVKRVQAFSHGDSLALPVSYDAARGWYRIELPPNSAAKVDAPTLQRIRLRLRNPNERPQVVRINFSREGSVQGITGLVPLLRDARQYPVGIPVQISKNWHQQSGKNFLYQGSWLHALTMLALPGQFEGDLELCIARNFWGQLPVASHAQLCLIGWGTDQLWDQAAIGSWGESICYDPDVCLQRSMIDDIRPLMVTPMKTKNGKWGWTNNVGGGDFLVYYNENNQKQLLTRMRTAYLSQGPNLTEVVYSGISADGNLSATMRVMTPRCDDINRAYHTFRYDVLKPTRFKRLAFYQVGADKYNDHQFLKLARGNSAGLLEEWDAARGGGRYQRKGIPCPGENPWFSLHQAISKDLDGGGWANRGLVVRSWKARLGGRDCPPFAASYGTENGPDSCNVELAPPAELTKLEPGDFVEATVELLVLPRLAQDYYGPNEKLRKDLRANENTWKPVLRQASGGSLALSMTRGMLRQSCPVRIELDSAQAAEFAVAGGVGYSPVTFTGLRHYRDWQLYHETGNGWSAIDQAVFGNDFWQTNKTEDGRFAITYNVLFDAAAGLQRFRFAQSGMDEK
jgi:hypothetical protein